MREKTGPQVENDRNHRNLTARSRCTHQPLPHLRHWRCWNLFFILILLLISFPGLRGEIYFKDTDQELEVIRIKGENPGLTVLIFGGIHGDEPGGYFSSEVLSKIKLMKGNLIIVPRVNFPSIMLNRREIYGDMNRKFGRGGEPNDPDNEVVRLLKGLMEEADVFINLHDANGFHRETYISKKYNPTSYGQSLIIDCADFYSRKLDRQVNLGEIGKRVLERVNRQIENKEHHFGFWDHNSLDPKTRFPEMKKSATYYALTAYSIPAFGLETSNDLPSLEYKVKYQLLVVKEILSEFGLEFVYPTLTVETPVLYWVEILKNGKDFLRIRGNTNLRLDPGDKIVIKAIKSNYETGLSANISDWGNINDMNKEYIYSGEAEIQVKKNHLTMGKIYLRGYREDSLREILVKVKGEARTIPTWGKLEIQKDRYFSIMGARPSFTDLRFDVRGYNLPRGKADDSGVRISPGKLLKKYSFQEKGQIYFVKIYKTNVFAGEFQVEIQ